MSESLKTECFKCGAPIWVPDYEYVESNRNFCYPCANSYMGHTGVSPEKLDKLRTDVAIENQ